MINPDMPAGPPALAHRSGNFACRLSDFFALKGKIPKFPNPGVIYGKSGEIHTARR